ncbi:MAG: hypothetical protein OEY36_01430 [Gammaproteobacteria bacterium]|nr:hypothetical protein [Gammaproteobacteria bacterium]
MKTESYQIDNSTEYRRVKRILSKKTQPGKIMRFLMNAFESYRQARKLGWSRPWNKYNLTVFQSFRLNFSKDSVMHEQASRILQNHIAMPASAKHFIKELLADNEHLTGFVFVHDYQDGEQLYEGVTYSLGRVKDKKYRDRIDLILESPVYAGKSQGLSRIRVYIDPFMLAKEPLWSSTHSENLSHDVYELFDQLANCSWQWPAEAGRSWNHWTADYINYFGPRQKMLATSYFYQADRPKTRVQRRTEQAA